MEQGKNETESEPSEDPGESVAPRQKSNQIGKTSSGEETRGRPLDGGLGDSVRVRECAT